MDELPEVPPLTLEAVERLAGDAYGLARAAAENAYISRVLVENLFLMLHRAQVLDGQQALADLQRTVQALTADQLAEAYKPGLLETLDQLRKALRAVTASQGMH